MMWRSDRGTRGFLWFAQGLNEVHLLPHTLFPLWLLGFWYKVSCRIDILFLSLGLLCNGYSRVERVVQGMC